MPFDKYSSAPVPGAGQPGFAQDFALQEHMADLVREKIPERAVNALGSGAFGRFTVTDDISKFTRAALFSEIGNSCRVFARFSSMFGEKGSPDTARDIKGFALKFYTADGNWDLACNSMPVFCIKDVRKYPAYVASQKKNPKTNLRDYAAMWDFWSQTPESLHQLLMLMSTRGMPAGYRHMHGYGTHAFAFTNAENERFWVKFHLKSQQGTENFNQNNAPQNPDFAHEDLLNAIGRGDFPRWKFFVQVMSEVQAQEFRWNPFDATKVWPHDEFPLLEAGELVLDEAPEDYFASVEQSAFSPANLVEGIGLSPDKVLQARIFSYADAQRYRLGKHYNRIEVNAGKTVAPVFAVPEDFTGFTAPENENDHYTQPGLFFTKALRTQDERDFLIETIAAQMKQIGGEKARGIIYRQLCHFFRANIELGMKVAAALGVSIDADLMNHVKEN